MTTPTINAPLQELLRAIADPDGRAAITNALNNDPVLLTTFNKLASGANGVAPLTKIEYNPDAKDTTGFFARSSDGTNVLHMGFGWLSSAPTLPSATPTIDKDKLAYLMAHEGEHHVDANNLDAADINFQLQVQSIAASTSADPHDYTDAISTYQHAYLRSEGKADIAGWNAAVQNKSNELGRPLKPAEVGDLSLKFNLSFYDDKGRLKSGFTETNPATPGQISTSDPANIANATANYLTRNPSLNNGTLVTYPEFRGLDALLGTIAQAEDGKTFSINYATVGFNVDPSDPNNTLSTAAVNNLLITSGLMVSNTDRQFTINNTADNSVSTFTIQHNQISLAMTSVDGSSVTVNQRTYNINEKVVGVKTATLISDHVEHYKNGALTDSNSLAISADSKSVTTSADNNGDGKIDFSNTSIYSDKTRSTLSSEISDRFNYGAGTVTTSVINYNPGGNMCTFDTKVSTILGGSWLGGVTGTESVSELGRSIVTADISGVGISIDANSADISLASGASAIVNGDGNTISLASAATLTINGSAEVKTSKGVFSVSGQSVVSESANGQVDVINGGLADISVLDAANASADPIGTLANALAGQDAIQTNAGVTQQPNGDQTFTADDGSTLTMHTDPVTGVTTVSSTPAPVSNLLGSGLGGNPAFTSATSSTASLSPNGTATVTYGYSNGTNMTAITPPGGVTTYTSNTTIQGYPAVVSVWTSADGKPITSGDGSPVTGALISGGPPPPTPPATDAGSGGSSGGNGGGGGGGDTTGGDDGSNYSNEGRNHSTPTSSDSSDSSSGGGGDSPPILIDMDGDGVELIARSASSVYFDSLGDGLLHHTGWVGSDDAMVVEDLNRDAKITLGSEISFALRTAADDSDLQALISLHDTNGDGQISADDTGFENLRLWRDANSNGITDAGELMTFADAGLVSISGQRRIVNYNTGDATVSAMSTATFESNGQTSTHAVADVSFQVEATVFQSASTNAEGNLIATTVDGRHLLQANAALSKTLSSDLDGALGSAQADTITATKSAWIVGGGGNDVIYGSAQDDWLQGGSGSDLLVGGDGNDTLVMDAQDNPWLIQGGKGFDTVIVEGSGGVTLDMALSTVEAAYGGNGNDVFTNSNVGSVLMSGGGGDDILTGGSGADVLQGDSGDDTLEGGAGNDVLMGGAGNDTYILRAGTGVDTLRDTAGTDRILVRGNYSASDIVLTRRDQDVILTLNGSSDSLVLSNWFGNVANQTSAGEIESIQFENGSAAIDANYIHSLLDNHAPTPMADTAQTQEDAPISASGNVLTNDTDQDITLHWDSRQHLSISDPGTIEGTYGQLLLNSDGGYSYAVNSSLDAVQALGRNAVLTETFSYIVQDNAVDNKSASSTLTVTITGTNDGPQAIADVAAVSEDNVLNASGNVLANDKDVDVGDVLSVTNTGVIYGIYGDLTLSANGAYSYSLNNAAANVQSLRGGQQVNDSFAYTATDGLATSDSVLTLTVTGKNDAPVAFADAAAVKEDTTLVATGNVLANDTDPDQGTVLSVTNTGVYAGKYGTLTLSANGSYSYTLNNSAANVQALADGQVVTDQFSYAIQDDDAQPLTAASTLTLTITGTNDAPTVAAALVTQAAREKQAFSYTVPASTFADVDNGDVLTYSALAINTAGTTQALPSWLSFNATTRTFSGTPGSADGGSFDFQVTATDKLGASVSTRFTLDIADEYAGTGANINVITGNWTNDTLNGTSRSETFYGNGGTDRILAGEGNNTVISTGGDTYVSAGAGNDTITTSYGNDTIYAGDGINKVNAGGGNNLVVTGAGDDTITTDWGFSTINAGAGNNTIVATGDATNVTTGAGNDSITTSYGNDTINAGDGNNTINAGGGNNLITAGSGNDVITTDWGNSTINAGDGTNTITANGGNTVVTTGSGADRITTGSGNDTINSGAGNDVISAGWGSDVINAGAGDDTITTGGGNDIVRAGLGNDTIIADQWSDDKYYYARGDGRDTLTDSGGMDTLVLENIRSDQLWFTHVGNDLNVSVVGSSDGVTIKNWYTGLQYPGAQNHVEQFQTSDGKVLLDSQVQNLVNAMAAFAPPAAGQTNLTGSTATTLAPVLVANWH